MTVCWTVLLPLIVAYVFTVPCLMYSLDAFPTSLVL
jgi:hypothetical protein